MSNLLASLLIVFGVLVAVAGAFAISVPAGVTALGVAFVVVGYLGGAE